MKSNISTAQRYCNQETPRAKLSSTSQVSSVTNFDYEGDTDMENSSSDASVYVSPSDNPAMIPESVEYVTPQRQEICFGMVRSNFWPSRELAFLHTFQICDVEAQLLDNPHIFDDANLVNEQESSQDYYQLRVISRNNYFVLQSFTEIEIGALNTAISHCFQELSGTASVRYEVFVNYNALREATQAWKRTGKRGTLPIDVNVYGSRDATGAVGRVFSTARLYFQHPYHYDSSAKYDNPHYLSFSNIANPESPIISSENTSVYQTERSTTCNISKVLENLDQQEYVRQADIDSRIRTPLLKFVPLFYLSILLM